MGQGKIYKCNLEKKDIPTIEDAIGSLGDLVSVTTLCLMDNLKTSCCCLYNLFTKYKSICSQYFSS